MNSLDEITQRLQTAVIHGDTELVFSLIEKGASVNQRDKFGELPLHTALRYYHTELALSLIKHGASVNQGDKYGRLPVSWCVHGIPDNDAGLNDEILTKLIPGGNMDVLKTICQIFRYPLPTGTREDREEHNLEMLSSTLHKLIQHLIVVNTLSITMRKAICGFKFKINQHEIVRGPYPPVKNIYLCSVLFIVLGCNVSHVDAIASQLPLHLPLYLADARAIDTLWNIYRQPTGVRKLQALCIQKSRQFMNSLTDESFQSLPVPSYLQKMLMLQDIADVLFEGYKMWPKRICIEELM